MVVLYGHKAASGMKIIMVTSEVCFMELKTLIFKL